MVQAIHNNITSKFHNLSNEMLADAIGNADLALKAHEAEVKSLKDEFKNRGLAAVEGEQFVVTSTPQISSRLNTSAVREYLGADAARFEVRSITQVIRVKEIHRLPAAA